MRSTRHILNRSFTCTGGAKDVLTAHHKTVFEYEDSLSVEITNLVFLIVSVIFCGAGFYQSMGGSDGDMPFHEVIYFVVVTISTAGYGDITPKTTQGQFIVIGMIIAGFALLPPQVGRIMDNFKWGTYSGEYIPEEKGGHIILSGDVSFETILDFLQEFFHVAQGGHGKKVVIMSDVAEPENAMLNILHHRLSPEPLFKTLILKS